VPALWMRPRWAALRAVCAAAANIVMGIHSQVMPDFQEWQVIRWRDGR